MNVSVCQAYTFEGTVINFSFIPIVYFLFPETGRLSLEQIDHIFEGKGHGWNGLTQGIRESAKRSLRIQNNIDGTEIELGGEIKAIAEEHEGSLLKHQT